MKVFIGLECVVVVCTSYWTWGFVVLLVLCACWPIILAQIYIIKRIKKKKSDQEISESHACCHGLGFEKINK